MILTQYPSREEWLAARRNLVTASRAPIILGVSPWGSRYAEWSEAVGLTKRDQWAADDERNWGTLLEPVILKRWCEVTGRSAHQTPNTLAVDDTLPWLAASPDGLTDDAPANEPVEIKTASAYAAKDWGEGVPVHYQVQAQVQMRVLGAARCHIAALLGGRTFRHFVVERDDELISGMLPHLEEFVAMVREQRPPSPDGSDETTSAIKAAFPHPAEDEDAVMLTSPEVLAAHREREEAIAAIKAAEEKKARASNVIMAALATYPAGRLPDGSGYTWREEKRKGYTKIVEPWSGRVLRSKAAKEKA